MTNCFLNHLLHYRYNISLISDYFFQAGFFGAYIEVTTTTLLYTMVCYTRPLEALRGHIDFQSRMLYMSTLLKTGSKPPSFTYHALDLDTVTHYVSMKNVFLYHVWQEIAYMKYFSTGRGLTLIISAVKRLASVDGHLHA